MDPPYPQRQLSTWTSGDQPKPFGMTLGTAAGTVGVGAGLYFGAGMRFGNKRGMDYLVGGIRALEDLSPGHIFRTFQLSHILSPWETHNKFGYHYVSPYAIREARTFGLGGKSWISQMESTLGQPFGDGSDILKHGFRFENGQILLGKTGDKVLLKHAQAITSPGSARGLFQESWARSLAGGPVSGIESAVQFRALTHDIEGKVSRQRVFFSGGQSRLQMAWRHAAAVGTTAIERLNRLAAAPVELFGNVPVLGKIDLSVKPSSGLKTFGKLFAKIGLGSMAISLAYQQIDYYTRESKSLDKTVFNEGITAGLATMFTRANVATSKIAEKLGLHDYREEQERIAPGSTSIATLAAFPIMGALGGLGVNYMERLARHASLMKQGLSSSQATIASSAVSDWFRKEIYGKPMKEGLLRGAEDRTLDLISTQSAKMEQGFYGKLAKKLQQSRFGKILGEITPSSFKWKVGGLAGLALIAPFIPGALAPSTRPEELKKIYSGEQEVAIRKGRWWEANTSPWEGGRIDRYRKHWFPRMLARAKEKSIWGEDAPSPIGQWARSNFTYELERKLYADRPYPISAPALEHVPLIGPLLSGTIGKLIKPPALMHQEEWMRQGTKGPEYLQPAGSVGSTLPNPELGERGQGEPISPYEAKSVIGSQIYRVQEAIGLPGFMMSAIKEKLTGSPEVFDQDMRLASFGQVTSPARSFFDEELGGMLMSNELWRRLYPHSQRQIPLYNPIPNQSASWLPGPGDRSFDFHRGDPFAALPSGEERLPGIGYETLHPEVKGVDPEDYPLVHKVKILGDVAPYSEKFQQYAGMAQKAMKAGHLSREDREMYQTVMEQVESKKNKKQFVPYKYRERDYATVAERALAEWNQKKKGEKDPGWFEKTVGKFWESLTHGSETPLEFLTPVSPASKFVHQRTAVEDYEKTQVFGTATGFWQTPYKSFIRPFIESTKRALGSEEIPEHVQDQRQLEKHFDLLKYIKYTRLKETASKQEDQQAARQFEAKRRETLVGINPYTQNYSSIYRSLPRRERDYFKEFVKADATERTEILKLIPENEKALYMARWQATDAQGMKKAIEKGLLSEEETAAARQEISQLYDNMKTEGFPKSKDLWAEYLATRLQGESYPDWYRRTKMIPESHKGMNIPGPFWAGWHPQVQLDDIKLKVVQELGESHFDYDLWPDRARSAAGKPYLDEAAQELMTPPSGGANETRDAIERLLVSSGIRDYDITVIPSSLGSKNQVDLDVTESRDGEIRELLRKGEI